MAVTELNADNFDSETGSGLTLVDFWATWCAPCRALGPVLDKLSEELGDKVKFTKVNTQDEPDLAGKFDVQALPTVVLLKDGREVDRFMGLRDADFVKEFIEKNS